MSLNRAIFAVGRISPGVLTSRQSPNAAPKHSKLKVDPDGEKENLQNEIKRSKIHHGSTKVRR